jgi:hypothetical protein
MYCLKYGLGLLPEEQPVVNADAIAVTLTWLAPDELETKDGLATHRTLDGWKHQFYDIGALFLEVVESRLSLDLAPFERAILQQYKEFGIAPPKHWALERKKMVWKKSKKTEKDVALETLHKKLKKELTQLPLTPMSSPEQLSLSHNSQVRISDKPVVLTKGHDYPHLYIRNMPAFFGDRMADRNIRTPKPTHVSTKVQTVLDGRKGPGLP